MPRETVKLSAQTTAFQQRELLRPGMMFSFRPGWSELSAAAIDRDRILCAIEVANDGPIAVTCVTYSPDFAKWKWEVLPGSTITLAGGISLPSAVPAKCSDKRLTVPAAVEVARTSRRVGDVADMTFSLLRCAYPVQSENDVQMRQASR